MVKLLVVLTLLGSILQHTHCARILAIMPTPSYSHQIVFNPLWSELSRRGHQLTLFTTDPIKTASFRQIDWSFAYELWHIKHNVSEIISNFNRNLVKCLVQYADMMEDITEQELQHPQVQSILHNESERFDLVVVEFLYPAMVAFSTRFHCPFIAISPMDITNFAHEALGDSISPALFPDFISPFDSEMNFFERVINTFYYLGSRVFFKYYMYPRIDCVVRRHFGNHTPGIEEMQSNASLVFLNTNPIVHSIRPLMGNVLAVGGGAHVVANQSLPEEIKTFLDAAVSGAIYFSLGTNVKSRNLPESVKHTLVDTFTDLPYRVLWKFEEEFKPAANENMMMRKWLPQQQILRHPNVKLFITQGGLQSLEEAIYNAVPVVAMPVYVDQFANARRVTRKGLGVVLDPLSLDKDTLKRVIREVITVQRYKDTAVQLSDILKGQPVSGLEKMVRWTEYVLKHKGAKFLHSSPPPLYQYVLLDVLMTFLLVTVLVAILIRISLKSVFVYIKERRRDKLIKLD